MTGNPHIYLHHGLWVVLPRRGALRPAAVCKTKKKAHYAAKRLVERRKLKEKTWTNPK